MNPQAGVWGIDLGQCGLKAIRIQDIDGQLVATAFDYVEHPKILSQPDADPDQLTREALEKFLSRNTIRGDIVAVSVPGQNGLARFVKLPPVEEKKIADIVRFEAKQQIPFNLEEVVWDFQKIGAGTVTDGFAMDTEIGLFAMKRDLINKNLQHFKDVKVEVHVIQMAPLALCNYASYDLLKKGLAPAAEPAEEGQEQAEPGCVVVLDIGTDTSNLVITDGNKIIWQRPIPLGGNHFTRALTKDLKLTFAKAEHLKRNATKSPDLKKILTALKPVLNDFVSEVQRSLGYFTNTHRDAQIEYMMGLGNAFRLPGLQRFLEEKLGISVRKVQKLERLNGDGVLTAQVFSENIMTFAVAYGLALQGLQRTKLMTNLLPPEIRVERLIKAKKPWAVASAAALLVGLGSLLAGFGLSYRAFAHPDVEAAIAKVKATQSAADDAKNKFKTAQDAAHKEKESVDSIVAGQGEFLNWLEFLSFVSKAIPQPDGRNLPANVRKKYWSEKPKPDEDRPGAMSGMEAYEAYMDLQKGMKRTPVAVAAPTSGIKGAGPKAQAAARSAPEDLGEGIDDRIQLNVEAVDCRFVDDLGTFFNALHDQNIPTGNWRPLEQANKAPDGKGWVVEIRGYTFHHRKRVFLMDTYVENLVAMGMPDLEASKTAPAPQAEKVDPNAKKGPSDKADPNAKKGPSDKAAHPGLPDKGPVLNRISHVVLFAVESDPTSDTQGFKLIANSALDAVMGGGSGSGKGGPGGAGPSMSGMKTNFRGDSGSNRTGWSPLGTGFGGGGSGKGAGGKGMTGLRGNRSPQGGPDANQPTQPASTHMRTEFVILFLWKEPIPSDALFSKGLTPSDTGTSPRGRGRPSSR